MERPFNAAVVPAMVILGRGSECGAFAFSRQLEHQISEPGPLQLAQHQHIADMAIAG